MFILFYEEYTLILRYLQDYKFHLDLLSGHIATISECFIYAYLLADNSYDFHFSTRVIRSRNLCGEISIPMGSGSSLLAIHYYSPQTSRQF